MSLFGSLMGDFDDDLFMGNHMNAMNMQMRSMNRLMNSLMPDPFNMLTPFDGGFQNNAMMERHGGHAAHGGHMGGLFGFPAMPNMNRLLSADIGSPNGASYCSSSVISMSSGPDGRPQIYQATSSTKSGPGGIRETRKTVQDSAAGIKKMAIGHHIGERAHIIEKEQDLRSGQLEENQEFINLEEEEAEDFDREFTSKARMFSRPQEMLSIEPVEGGAGGNQRHRYALPPQQNHRQLPALPAPPNTSQHQQQQQQQHHNSSPTPNNTTILSTSSTSPSMSPRANASASSNVVVNHNNNNNNSVMSMSPRVRAYRNHLAGATPRRPLRTPTSSPLTTTPTNHSLSTATSPSVHPHPYNAAAARRNYRSKHSKQHQQTQQQQQQQQQHQETNTTQQQAKKSQDTEDN